MAARQWIVAHAALLTILVAALVPAFPAHATMICRWVDDSGRTHLADIVPEKYARSAQCTDSKQFDIAPERTQQAQQRARQLRERADISGQPASDVAPPAPAPQASAAPAAKRPARGVDQSTDCATWRRLYEESAACFGPYRTVGGIKAEAFDKCNVVPSPDMKCGPPVN